MCVNRFSRFHLAAESAKSRRFRQVRQIRHRNLIERTFGETRRRTKVIGRLPGETTCLALVWAVLDRASRGWRGLATTPKGLRLLQDLRRQLLHPLMPEEVVDQGVTAAA